MGNKWGIGKLRERKNGRGGREKIEDRKNWRLREKLENVGTRK